MRANCARKQVSGPVDAVCQWDPEGLQGRNLRHRNPMTLGALTPGMNLARGNSAARVRSMRRRLLRAALTTAAMGARRFRMGDARLRGRGAPEIGPCVKSATRGGH
ncbi:hypothetical protein MTO96_006632 [Rhipicephalus appendiculatus]